MLDIQMQSLLQGMRQAGVPDMADLPPQAARQVYSRIMAAAAEPVRAVAIADHIIAGPGGDLALRVYAPRQPDPRRGIVLYLHGGGFVVGTPRDYDSVASALCEQSGCVVVQPNYRLAPEHPFPAAVEDAWAAACWVAAHAHALGAQPRIAVVGDSAGGNLAAVLALLARDCAGPAIVQQTLIYPVVATRPETTGSYRRYGSGYTLTTRHTHYFHDLYRGGGRPTATAPGAAGRAGCVRPAALVGHGGGLRRAARRRHPVRPPAGAGRHTGDAGRIQRHGARLHRHGRGAGSGAAGVGAGGRMRWGGRWLGSVVALIGGGGLVVTPTAQPASIIIASMANE